eukprot:NODE_108_length_3325_cov_82.696127_g100_i0.p1 GENE.NODE_108_length_3325_cov_82.696127_g100_i0~~NODE_108_length_3325_cov_82.696127_g100_i0.p1  ORF type:complete len:1018 (+),score=151.08 NODE_108_length_3325_cov_82.696127_g100_i0:143-3196(+)
MELAAEVGVPLVPTRMVLGPGQEYDVQPLQFLKVPSDLYGPGITVGLLACVAITEISLQNVFPAIIAASAALIMLLVQIGMKIRGEWACILGVHHVSSGAYWQVTPKKLEDFCAAKRIRWPFLAHRWSRMIRMRPPYKEVADRLNTMAQEEPTIRTHNFLEVSPLSFQTHYGPKMKEGFIWTGNAFSYRMIRLASYRIFIVYVFFMIASGSGLAIFEIGMLTYIAVPLCLFLYLTPQFPDRQVRGEKLRWLIIKPNCIAFYYSTSRASMRTTGRVTPNGVIAFDVGSTVTFIERAHGGMVELRTQTRVFKFRSYNGKEDTKVWAQALGQALQEFGCHPTPHQSFSPMRVGQAQWYVDGRSTYIAMAAALESAQREILITGWMFSPELLLHRPTKQELAGATDEEAGEEFGEAKSNECSMVFMDEGGSKPLTDLLRSKAEAGVQIRVMIFGELPGTVPIGSQRATMVLQALHPNIAVIRHPKADVLLWSHHEKVVIVDQHVAFVGGIDLAFGRFDDHHHSLSDPSGRIWAGKDYYNPRVAPFNHLERPWEDAFNRDLNPRMPWHDIHMAVVGPPALDLARHFVQRWNLHLKEFQVKQSDRRAVQVGPLLPCVLPKDPYLSALDTPYTVPCQVLRSTGLWSVGTAMTERSIQNAYLEAIEFSHHFIYIENQFFVSSTAGPQVSNVIVQALVDRVKRAMVERAVFRLVVVLPNYPEGSVRDRSVGFVLHWMYNTICRGPTSLMTQLTKEAQSLGLCVDDYVVFCCLRQTEKVEDRVHETEQIYVHAKLLIVDDRLVICGSANLNDRSMVGNRDSELAVAVYPPRDDTVATTMNGQEWSAAPFAHSLRTQLWAEHLGLLDEDGTVPPEAYKLVADPTCEDTYKRLWLATATSNSAIHSKVFPNMPSNDTRKFKDLPQFRGMMSADQCESWMLVDAVGQSFQSLPGEGDLEEIDDFNYRGRAPSLRIVEEASPFAEEFRQQAELLLKLKGHLFLFPLDFLKDEDLTPKFGERELLVPAVVFT